jgi:hypothetical protein
VADITYIAKESRPMSGNMYEAIYVTQHHGSLPSAMYGFPGHHLLGTCFTDRGVHEFVSSPLSRDLLEPSTSEQQIYVATIFPSTLYRVSHKLL